MAREPLLETESLVKSFGGLTATNDISVELGAEEVCAIIGPNGAGKTTFFNLLTGLLEPTSGSIYFEGEDITDLSIHQTARRGIVRSFQITNVFDELTVFENVRNAVQANSPHYRSWKPIEDIEELNDRAKKILELAELSDNEEQIADTLSHGEKRTLDIAIALGAEPDLLLLDEPTSGMSVEESQDTLDLIGQISTETPIIVIEHKMEIVMNSADRILVMHNGEVIADGPPKEIRNDERVVQVYLGGQYE